MIVMSLSSLNYFTFLDDEEINALREEVDNRPENRVAQKRLAEEMVKGSSQ